MPIAINLVSPAGVYVGIEESCKLSTIDGTCPS